MKDISNKFENFEPNEKQLRLYDKLISAIKQRSPKNTYLKSAIKQDSNRFNAVAKVYSGSHFFKVRAEGKSFSEAIGKLRAKTLVQLKRWRSRTKSHPKRHQHLSLAYDEQAS